MRDLERSQRTPASETSGRRPASAPRENDHGRAAGRSAAVPVSAADAHRARDRIADPGRNCWRVARADRAAFLVDPANYYRVAARTISNAQHAVYILGWDIHSRTRLVEDLPIGDLPSELGPLLDAVARRRRGLRVYVLDWDFAMIYTLDREMLPVFQFGWRTHRRVHFRLDADHPVGGSQHQKIVVVDDAVGFVGGIDIAAQRWDTPSHLPNDSHRVDPWGRTYPPFHDVQLAVDGGAARALGELARERWARATGEKLRPPPPAADPWPVELDCDVCDVDVALARTVPEMPGRPEVREVESLFVDMIAAARDTIYVENQYFTSSAVGDALAARLSSSDCPEVVLVLPKECHGWLEESAMGVMRARLLRRLRDADRCKKLRVYYVAAADCTPCTVHAKVMIVDDVAVRIGSANLNNRSMGLDSECDALIEAVGRPDVRKAIADLRARLVSEHLRVPADVAALAIEDLGSVGAAIERLRGRDPSLVPLEPEVDPWLDSVVPDAALLDPERPVAMTELIERIVPVEVDRTARERYARFALVAAALIGLAASWRWTPLRQVLEPDRILAAANALRDAPFGAAAGAAAFVVAGLLALPVTVLMVLAGFVYGGLLGYAVALFGALGSASANYAIGRRLRRDAIRKLGGNALNRLSRRLATGGVTAVFAVRFIPVAPFSIVNLVAGATRLPFRDFLLGTLLAMAPGIALLVAFGDQAAEFIAEPKPSTAAKIVAAAAGVAATALGMRTLLVRRERTGTREEASGSQAHARAAARVSGRADAKGSTV